MHSLSLGTSFPRRGRLQDHSGRYLLWLAGAILLVMLWTISSQNVTPIEFVYAGVLLAISIQAYISWSRARSIRIPIWALVCAAHFVFYGVARGIFISRDPTKFILANIQESMGRACSGFDDFWVLAHISFAGAELEVCVPRDHRRIILRPRVDEDRVTLARNARACAGRYYVARIVPVVSRAQTALSVPLTYRTTPERGLDAAA